MDIGKILLIGVCFLGTNIFSMDLLKELSEEVSSFEVDLPIIGKDDVGNVFQVKSLDQLSQSQGELARTACAYYALNNCIEIMKTFLFQMGESERRLESVISQFETINSPQRLIIFKKRLVSGFQETIKDLLRNSTVLKLLDRTSESMLINFVRSVLLSVSASSSPLVDKEGSISWSFSKESLNESCQKLLERDNRFSLALESFGKALKHDNLNNTVLLNDLLWKHIAGLENGNQELMISYEESLRLSLDSKSSLCKTISYGNWLDAEDITTLITKINEDYSSASEDTSEDMSDDELLLEAIYPQISFDSYRKKCKAGALEGMVESDETIADNYALNYYATLKKVKTKIDTTNEDVVAGFILHEAASKYRNHSWPLFPLFGKLIEQKDLGAHWIALVVVRLKDQPLRYYIADSWGNKSRLNCPLVKDVIAYIEGKASRENPFSTQISEDYLGIGNYLGNSLFGGSSSYPHPNRHERRSPRHSKGGGAHSEDLVANKQSTVLEQEKTPSLSQPVAVTALGLGSFVLYALLQNKEKEEKNSTSNEEAEEQDESQEESEEPEDSFEEKKPTFLTVQ